MTAVLLDTETTGFTSAEIIELAWVELEETTFDRAHNIYCNRYKPEGAITWGAVAVHNIIPSDLTHCPPSAEAASHLPTFSYLIGHNIDFDWEQLGKPKCKRICTLAMSRALFPDLDSHKLTSLFYFMHGMNDLTRDVVRNAHSALHDVSMNHQLLQFLLTKKPEIKTFEQLHAFSEHCRIPTVMTFGKYKGSKISEVDKGYVAWYRKQPDPDPYLLMAFTKAGK